MATLVKKPYGLRSQTSESRKKSENSAPNHLTSTPQKPIKTQVKISENFVPNFSSSTPRKSVKPFASISENSDPNISISSPSGKPEKSPAIKVAKSKKSAPRTPIRTLSSPAPAKDRRPTAAKKTSKIREDVLDSTKCREVADKAVDPHQEELFSKDQGGVIDPLLVEADGWKDCSEKGKKNWVTEKNDPEECSGCSGMEGSGDRDSEGSSKVRKMKSMMLEEARCSLPEQGAGRVMYLVKTFERLLSLSKDAEVEKEGESKRKVMNWALPGLYQPPKAEENEVSYCPLSTSSDSISLKDFARDCDEQSSVDSNGDRLSWGSNTSSEGRRSRRSSIGSSGRSWDKKLKAKNLQPFKLRTEQRGRHKEEQFLKKLKEMLLEEERQRIPIAQGLPWTTDAPECLVKPPVKESTEPLDIILRSDVRAVERSEFDLHIAERLNLSEYIKMERERQRKMEEEEEIKRFRRELVPRAQPMPYFDHPFIPKKSTKPQTVPKDPRFRTHPLKAWYILLSFELHAITVLQPLKVEHVW